MHWCHSTNIGICNCLLKQLESGWFRFDWTWTSVTNDYRDASWEYHFTSCFSHPKADRLAIIVLHCEWSRLQQRVGTSFGCHFRVFSGHSSGGFAAARCATVVQPLCRLPPEWPVTAGWTIPASPTCGSCRARLENCRWWQRWTSRETRSAMGRTSEDSKPQKDRKSVKNRMV